MKCGIPAAAQHQSNLPCLYVHFNMHVLPLSSFLVLIATRKAPCEATMRYSSGIKWPPVAVTTFSDQGPQLSKSSRLKLRFTFRGVGGAACDMQLLNYTKRILHIVGLTDLATPSSRPGNSAIDIIDT